MMRRLTTALTLAVLAYPANRAMTAAAAVSIKLATLAPTGTSYDLILKQMGEKWRKATNGEVTLRVYPGGSQGSEADTVGLMQTGNLDASLLTVTGLSEIEPTVTSLHLMPMAFRNLDEVVGQASPPRGCTPCLNSDSSTTLSHRALGSLFGSHVSSPNSAPGCAHRHLNAGFDAAWRCQSIPEQASAHREFALRRASAERSH